MAKSDEFGLLRRLIEGQRWAALATVDDAGQPEASMVAYAVETGFGGFLLHLSRLAAHTRNLLERPAASLVISQPDSGRGDPQQLARVALHGRVSVLDRESDGFASAKAVYLGRLPDSARLFDFQDFILLRLTPENARYVGGFARAHTLGPADLARAAEWTGG